MGTRTRPVDMHPPYDHQPLAPDASVLYPAADVVNAMVSQPSETVEKRVLATTRKA